MAMREQIGILLIAAVAAFVVTGSTIDFTPGEGIERLGYDLPAAAYSQRPGEESNRFRVSLVPKQELELVEMQFYWLGSKAVPNSTVPGPSPTTPYIEAIMEMATPWTDDVLIETDVEYNGTQARLQLYDFGGVLGVAGANLVGSPAAFAFVVGPGQEILRYFEGSADFFIFPPRTVSSLRLTSKGETQVFGAVARADPVPRYGAWQVSEAPQDEVIEMAALLDPDARLYVEDGWGKTSERLQVTWLAVNGENPEILTEFLG
jgi:hypothetical protein